MLNRRRFLKLAGITALATAAPRIPLAFGDGGLLHLTATEAVRHISEGSLSAETYARALLDQAERLSFLDTIISIDPDAVLEAAHQVDVSRRRGRRLGPLAGLPLLVKDNIDTKALPTTAGTPGLLSNRPTADAPVLNPLFQAGALLFAKANMHELAFGITSHNYHFGAVHNPYDATLIPGGSSGGTGAGIAARLCPAGVARTREGRSASRRRSAAWSACDRPRGATRSRGSSRSVIRATRRGRWAARWPTSRFSMPSRRARRRHCRRGSVACDSASPGTRSGRISTRGSRR